MIIEVCTLCHVSMARLLNPLSPCMYGSTILVIITMLSQHDYRGACVMYQWPDSLTHPPHVCTVVQSWLVGTILAGCSMRNP
jgi:hypothetical protein